MLAAIWSYGHRNPQGLAFQPGTDVLWESEHGPRGGDEINVIEAGKNYGWPVISYGMNDNGTPLTYETAREGMEQPKHYWTPSIAVCAIAFYEGDKFPSWRGNLFAGGLYSEELHRLTLKDKDVIGDKVVLRGAGRIRDVVNGPDGTLYLVLNSRRGDANRIVRMVAEQP
jgi:glucose/arabinose dehydrogenase